VLNMYDLRRVAVSINFQHENYILVPIHAPILHHTVAHTEISPKY